MSAFLALFVVPLAVVGTSMLSGVFGMAGGLILMGVYALLLPVPAAMVLHGATQFVANGSRAALLWRHVQWRPVAAFVAGMAAGTAAFAALAFTADRAVVFLALGGTALVARFMPGGRHLTIDRLPVAFAGGAVTTFVNLLSGVSGPLLDVLFVRSPLGRHAVIATKGVLQSAGHLLKIAYFAGAVATGEVPIWLYPVVAGLALVGTRLGRGLLDRIDDTGFRLWSGRIVVGLGLFYVARGVAALIP
jgi:hypothetical protein